MKIQHNSATKIDKIESYFGDDLLGCLCFGREGHEYNLAGNVNYRYLIDIDENNIIAVNQFWSRHDDANLNEKAEYIVRDVQDTLNVSRQRALELLDGSDRDCQIDTDYNGLNADWYVQQSMGLLAHALGYDAAEDCDEQGTVYIVYCVDRDIEEQK